MLGFSSVFLVGQKPSIIFNYSKFLSCVIHEKFVKLKVEGVFKHKSILVYMMLFYKAYKLKFQLQKMDDEGTPLSIIHWTSLVIRNLENY